MSDPIEELILKISADVAGVKAGLTAVAASSAELANKVKGDGESMFASFFKAELAVEALKKAFEFLKEVTVDFVEDSFKSIDAQAKLADRLGVNIQFLAALKVQGDSLNITGEEMYQMFGRLERSLGNIHDQGGPAADALNKLGITVDQIRTLHPEDQYKLIAERFSLLTDQTERASVATALFGREGLKMISILMEGGAGLEEAAKFAEEYGLSVSRFDAAKIEQANKAWREAREAIEGIANEIAIKLAPYVVAIADGFRDAAKEGHGFGDTIDAVMQFAVKTIDGLRLEWRLLQIGVAAVIEGVASFGYSVVTAVDVGAKALNYIGQVIRNLILLINDVGNVVIQTFSTGFTLAFIAVSRFLVNVESVFGESLIRMGKTIQGFAPATAVILQKSGDAITLNAARMDTALQGGAQKAEAAWSHTIEVVGNDWKGLLPQFSDIKMPFLDNLAESMKGVFIKTREFLDNLVNKPFDLTAAQDYFKGIGKLVDQAAAHTAKKRQEDLVAEKKADDQKQRWEAQTWDQKLGYATSTMNSLGELLEHGSRKQFEIGKKLQLAAAIADTAAGVAKTFQQFGWYALLGPAEAVAAAGAVQIAKISSMSYGGGGGGGGSAGVSAGSLPNTQGAQQSGVTGTRDGGQTINIALNGDNYSAQGVRNLINAIRDQIRDGVNIQDILVS